MVPSVLGIVAVTLLVMITPGPDMALVARNTLSGRRCDGWLTSCGVLTGNNAALGVG